MTFTNFKKLFAAALIAASGVFIGASTANATTSLCDALIEDNLLGISPNTNGGCEISALNTNDSPIPGAVNGDAFFTITDWALIVKNEFNPSLFSGSYDVSAFWASYESIMAIFKDGANTTIVGYLLTDDMGNWTTPFVDPPFSLPGQSTSAGTSHISFYGTTTVIPLPAAGFLLIGALGGLVALRRRRKTA